ncbi:MAG: ABC transporter permease [Elusimicrobia bacterium]|nr:ABC transporter permease [Elusimicrobiota bacterium]
MSSGSLWLLAWRNLWRHRRRTALTVLSVAAGLTGLVFGQSLLETIQLQLVGKSTGIHTGDLQVFDDKVSDFKFPDRWMKDPAKVDAVLRADPDVAAFERRVVVTGLVSAKKDSAGVLFCGVEPARDPQVLTISRYVEEGRPLAPGGDGAFIGVDLAARLGVGLGDELVLMGTARDGSMGAELAKVRGIFKTGSKTFDDQIVYVGIAKMQSLLGAEGTVNDFVVRLRDPERLEPARTRLAAALKGLPVQAVTWERIDAEIVGIRDYQDALLRIVLAVVFVIVALGILNTLLMSMFERVREFGLLMALGARREFIGKLVVAESVLMGALGAGLGLAAGAALIAYYARVGLALPVKDAVNTFLPFDTVLYLRFDWPRHVWALAAVFGTSALSGLPPALKAMRLRPAEALRQI